MSANVIQRKRRGNLRAGPQPKLSPPATAPGTDPTVVGRTCWDIVSVMLAAFKSPVVTITAVLVVGGGVTVLRIWGYGPRLSRGQDGGVSIGFGALTPMPTPAQATGNPYVIEAATALIRVNEVTREGRRMLLAQWRIVYTVRASRRISSTERVFREDYSEGCAHVERWQGDAEETHATGERYNVTLDLEAGQRRTFTTGANVLYDLPLKNDCSVLGGKILLKAGSNEYFLSYDNVEDRVDELSAIVEKVQALCVP